MELRHLRYFVAVAEEGSLTVAAARRLHTAQPSLSRQIRDLEHEVGEQLLTRSASGTTLTAAGRAFLDHARRSLAEADAAIEAARRAAQPFRPSFALGFLTGQEMGWLAPAMNVLRDELPKIDVTVSSHDSPQLADRLMRGKLDLAFMRPERGLPDLEYRLIVREQLLVVLPSDHRLAGQKVVAIQELEGEIFLGMSDNAPALQGVIGVYLQRSAIHLPPAHRVDNLAMAISLVASTRGATLLPAYARNFLPSSVISRPLAGDPPTIDLVAGFKRSNPSGILKLFLSRLGTLKSRPNQ